MRRGKRFAVVFGKESLTEIAEWWVLLSVRVAGAIIMVIDVTQMWIKQTIKHVCIPRRTLNEISRAFPPNMMNYVPILRS